MVICSELIANSGTIRVAIGIAIAIVIGNVCPLSAISYARTSLP